MSTLEEYTHLSLSELARLLNSTWREVMPESGRTSVNPITINQLRADVAAGAPTNPDGTINLVRYAAWLLARRNEAKA